MKNSLEKLKKKFKGDKKGLAAIDYLLGNLEDDAPRENFADLSLNIPKELKNQHDYAIFSDGGCRGNPGPGSWAALGQKSDGEVIFEVASFDQDTTNNRMELRGAIEAVINLKSYLEDFDLMNPQNRIYFYTDSNYVVQGLNSWRYNWKKRGWKKADNSPVQNVELWEKLDQVTLGLKNFQAIWVKGHSGHPQNERCDKLCNEILDREIF
jgi:ribonuclease HI